LNLGLKRNGFVSIESADRFCCVELAREQIAARQQEKLDMANKSKGAQLLSQRVGSFGIETTVDEAITIGRERLRDLTDVSVGVASLVGKGIGVAANLFRNIRNS